MHRHHSPRTISHTGLMPMPIIPSYFLGRPRSVYTARFLRRRAGAVDERR